jgi:F0F1-type ATP synthase delta subunit
MYMNRRLRFSLVIVAMSTTRTSQAFGEHPEVTRIYSHEAITAEGRRTEILSACKNKKDKTLFNEYIHIFAL